jgi:hypothetical protein
MRRRRVTRAVGLDVFLSSFPGDGPLRPRLRSTFADAVAFGFANAVVKLNVGAGATARHWCVHGPGGTQ